jgi:hypothetical protein
MSGNQKIRQRREINQTGHFTCYKNNEAEEL